MSKEDFGQFPHNTDVPANDPMTNQQGFHCPAQKVSDSKNVHIGPNSFQGNVGAVDGILLKLGGYNCSIKIYIIWTKLQAIY